MEADLQAMFGGVAMPSDWCSCAWSSGRSELLKNYDSNMGEEAFDH